MYEKKWLMPKARARKWIDPVGLQQTADDELKQELCQIARLNRVMMQTECHGGGLPVDDHADEHKERNAGQFGHSKLSESPAILCREVR